MLFCRCYREMRSMYIYNIYNSIYNYIYAGPYDGEGSMNVDVMDGKLI